MATTPTYSNDVKNIARTIVNADSTSFVDVYDNSAGSKSVRVEALNICSDDTSTVNIQFAIYNGSAAIVLGTTRAVTLSGTDGAAARVNAIPQTATVGPDGIPVIEIAAGNKLQAKSLVAVTAAKTVSLTGWLRTYV